MTIGTPLHGRGQRLPPRGVGTTRIVLVRHGEPNAAVRGRCYGRLDPGLSPRGRDQMRRTWRLLSREPVDAVYTSPARRAIESTRLRAGHVPVTVDARLREIDFGEFEGLTYDDIAARFPETYEQWMTRPVEVSFPGGDTFAAMRERVLEAIGHICLRHRGGTAVIVSHGGVNRIALAAALHLDPPRIFRLDQAYASLNVIDFIGDEPLVRIVNAGGGLRC